MEEGADMNMRDGSTRGILVASLLLLSLPALAYEGSSTVNFNVTGTIEAPSCEVGGTVEQYRFRHRLLADVLRKCRVERRQRAG